MLHVVTKAIPGPGGATLLTGLLVEPEEWKNKSSLVSLRYIRPATPVDLEGLDEVVVNEYGVSRINVFEPKTKKRARIRKAKHA